MPKGWRDWRVVLRAMSRLGVVQYYEDDLYVLVARFPHRGQAIRKWWLPAEVEAHLIRTLRIERPEYMQAIRAIEAEDHGESPVASISETMNALSLRLCVANVRQLCEQGARAGSSTLHLSLPEDVHIHAIVREARDHRDDLHLALETEVHAVMRLHTMLAWVHLQIPGCEPFVIGRPGYDD